MSRPTCSIIIPSRNCLNYLPTTLASIELQRVNDLQVVIVDDGSSDGTADWLRSRPKACYDLVIIETTGIGPSAARNVAVAAASGEFIAFLDADDLWWPGKLDRHISWHRANPQTGFSFTDYIHVTPDGRTLGTCFEYWQCAWAKRPDASFFQIEEAEAKLLATNLVGTSTVVANRAIFERIGGFSNDCRSAEDWDLWLRLAEAAPVACSTAVTMSYLMRPNGETSSRWRRLDAMRGIVDRYAGCESPVMRKAVRLARARIEVAEAEHARECGNLRKAASAHLKALTLAPSWRTGRALAADLSAVLRQPAPRIQRA